MPTTPQPQPGEPAPPMPPTPTLPPPPTEIPSPSEPGPQVAPPEIPSPDEPPETAPLPEPPLPDPGDPIEPPLWDATTGPPSTWAGPSVTRGAADVDTGEVMRFGPLDLPSDTW